MGSRSKGGYKDPLNKTHAKEERPQTDKPPKQLVLSRYRKRTRKYRKIK